MAVILEMPQYVTYQKNVAYAVLKLSVKSHSFNILGTMDVVTYPTIHLQRKYIRVKFDKLLKFQDKP